MRVVIAGAGSVGRSIARELLHNGHQVLVIDKDADDVQASRVPVARVTTVSGDIALDLRNSAATITSNSVSGNVTVRIPQGGFSVEANTFSGQVVANGRRLGNGQRGRVPPPGGLSTPSGVKPSGGCVLPTWAYSAPEFPCSVSQPKSALKKRPAFWVSANPSVR